MKTIIQHTYVGHIGEHALDWATDKERKQVKREINKLKKEGKYGQPIDITWTFKELPYISPVQDFQDYGIDMGFIIPDGSDGNDLTIRKKTI